MEFKHYSVLLQETTEYLNIRPDGIYVDGTLGGGGHACRVAERLSGKGRLIGMDQDADAIKAAGERLAGFSDRVTIIRSNYAAMKEELSSIGITEVDGILLDLGVSSYQLDDPQRGFTYREESAPLDMRMDDRETMTAADVVNGYSEAELYRIIRDYGEDKFAKNIAKHIVREREKNGPFQSMTDFCGRMDGGEWNKRSIESLIKAGAMDSLGGLRSQYMAVYKGIMDGIGQAKKNNIEGQMNLFDIAGDNSFQKTDDLPKLKEFLPKERLAMEREVLGIYVSGHPLAGYEERFGRKVSCTSLSFQKTEDDEESRIEEGEKVIIGGMVMGVSVKYTRKNEKMAIVMLEDFHGAIETLFFPKAFERYGMYLKDEEVLLVRGRANVSADGKANVIADSAEILELDGEDAPKSLWLKMAAGEKVTAAQIKEVLAVHKGDIPVYIYQEETKQKMKAERQFWVTWDEVLREELGRLLGEKNVVVKY